MIKQNQFKILQISKQHQPHLPLSHTNKLHRYSNLLYTSARNTHREKIKNNVQVTTKKSTSRQLAKAKLLNMQLLQPYKIAISNRFMSHRKTYSNNNKKNMKRFNNFNTERIHENGSFINTFLDENIEEAFRVIPPRSLFTPCQTYAVRIYPKPLLSNQTSTQKLTNPQDKKNLDKSNQDKYSSPRRPHAKQTVRYKMSTSADLKKIKGDSLLEPWTSKAYDSINF